LVIIVITCVDDEKLGKNPEPNENERSCEKFAEERTPVHKKKKERKKEKKEKRETLGHSYWLSQLLELIG